MYYIYHIEGIKIGCTEDLQRRVVEEQGYNDYEIIETHTDIYKASDREIQLQKEYGYRVDTTPYYIISQAGQRNVRTGHWKKLQVLGGKAAGKICAENGHMKRMSDKGILKTSKPILQYDRDGNFIKEYPSQLEASRQLNLNNKAISMVCRGKRNHTGGFVFKYKS